MSFREHVRRKHGLVPLLVIGSTWPEHWATLTTPPKPAAEDPHARARRLLNGHALPVPVAFIDADLQAVALMAQHDPRLAYVAGRAEHGQISQYLAGAPALIERYQNVPALARALIEAAMDAHRLGHPPGLPLPLLEAAAEGYLADSQWDLLEDDWFEQALAYTAAPLHGARGPLTRIRPRRGQSAPAHPHYRLVDYLEQHGRTDRDTSLVPAVLWEALIEHHASRDCRTVTRAARDRGLLRIAMRFYAIAAHASDNDALKEAAWLLVRAGRRQEAI